MNSEALRETIRSYNHFARWYHFNGHDNSIRCTITIFASISQPNHVCISAIEYDDRNQDFIVYVADRNCVDLVASNAPVSIVIDALLESSSEQWTTHSKIHGNMTPAQVAARAVAILEAIALMNIVSTEVT